MRILATLYIALLFTSIMLSSCYKSDEQAMISAAIHDDPSTIVYKIPTPGFISGISNAPASLPLIKTNNAYTDPDSTLGYILYCSNTVKLTRFLKDWGYTRDFINQNLSYEFPDFIPEFIAQLNMTEQPVIFCSDDRDKFFEQPVAVRTNTNPPQVYIRYQNSPDRHISNTFVEIGCKEIADFMGFSIPDLPVIDLASISIFFPDIVFKDLNCHNGNAISVSPFIAECEKASNAETQDETAFSVLAEFLGHDENNIDCNALWDAAKTLKEVDFEDTDLESIQPLSYLTKLRTINIAKTNVRDLRPLWSLKHLRSLDISENFDISNIDGIERLENLRHFDFTNTLLTDLTPLTNLLRLNTILFNNANLNAIDPTKCPIHAKSTALTDLCIKIRPNSFLAACRESVAANSPDVDIFRAMRNRLERSCNELDEYIRGNGLSQLSLDGEGIVRIDGIETMPDISILNLSNNAISDISSLAGLNELHELDISHNQITQLDAITEKDLYRRGKSLSIVGNPIERLPAYKDWCRFSISPAVSETLQAVNRAYNRNLCDADESLNLAITHLNLRGHGLIDPGPIGALTSLTHLNLSSNNIKSSLFLKNLSKLKVLNISQNKLTQLNGLEQSIQLQTLNASNNDLESIEALRGLPAIRDLNIGYNKGLKLQEEISGSQWNLTSLRKLNIDGIGSFSWGGIRGLEFITHLFAGHIGSIDMTDIGRFRRLIGLNLRSNNLTESSSIGNLTNLEILDLSGNSLTNVNGIKTLKKLKILRLNANQISNARDLKPINNLQWVDLRGNLDVEDCPEKINCVY